MSGRCFRHDADTVLLNLQCKDWASAFRKRTIFMSVYIVDKGQNWQNLLAYTLLGWGKPDRILGALYAYAVQNQN